jgi:hypothetical protein
MAKYSSSFMISCFLKLLNIQWTFRLSDHLFSKLMLNYSFDNNNLGQTILYIISYRNVFYNLILLIGELLISISLNFYVKISLQLFYQTTILLLLNFVSNFKFIMDQTTLNHKMVQTKEFKYFFQYLVYGR